MWHGKKKRNLHKYPRTIRSLHLYFLFSQRNISKSSVNSMTALFSRWNGFKVFDVFAFCIRYFNHEKSINDLWIIERIYLLFSQRSEPIHLKAFVLLVLCFMHHFMTLFLFEWLNEPLIEEADHQNHHLVHYFENRLKLLVFVLNHMQPHVSSG